MKKKVRFADDEKIKTLHANLLPPTQEAGMICMIDGETLFTFMKKTCVSNLGAFCHITTTNSCFYNITNINESLQGSSGSILTTKRGNYI